VWFFAVVATDEKASAEPDTSIPRVEGSEQGEAMTWFRGNRYVKVHFWGDWQEVSYKRSSATIGSAKRSRTSRARSRRHARLSGGAAGARLLQSERDDDTTTEASGTGANIDSVPMVPITTAAVLHENDSWRRRRSHRAHNE